MKSHKEHYNLFVKQNKPHLMDLLQNIKMNKNKAKDIFWQVI